MNNVIDLTIDWKRGTLKQKLARLPDDMNMAAVAALDEGAEFMKQMAKNLVRVDTGTLRKTIRKERGGTGAGWAVVSVRAGGYFVNPKTGKICNYAQWVEMNYPFMRPAYHMTESYIKNLIRQKVVESV